MNRVAWRAALTVIAPAAAGMCAWSLYTVAHDAYNVPSPLAALVGIVFDGTALACLYLASEAAKAGRTAAAPRLATLALAGVSIYLNIVHARLVHGGVPAAALYASPTAALLLVSDLSWSAARARARAEGGESPMHLPVIGGWGWLLAFTSSWKAVRSKAASHVASLDAAPHHPGASRPRTARIVLAERFATMDPADAIRIAADAHPHLAPAELASLLIEYGVVVDGVHVALVLGDAPRITVEREAAPQPSKPLPQPGRPADALPSFRSAASPDAHGASAGHSCEARDTAPDAPSKAAMVRDAAASLGAKATAEDIARFLMEQRGTITDTAYIRTVRSRDARKNIRNTSGGYL